MIVKLNADELLCCVILSGAAAAVRAGEATKVQAALVQRVLDEGLTPEVRAEVLRFARGA